MLNPCTKFEKPFVVEPQVVIFENYEKDRVYIKEVVVRNNDSLCETIHVTLKEDSCEEISLNVKGCQRLVPGLDVVLEVTFNCNRRYKCQKKDRVVEVELLVEIKQKQSYKFLLPIILLSSNPSFVFPKYIDLPTVCLGVLSSSTIYFCNNSPSTQRFSLSVSKDIALKPYRKVYSIPTGKHETLTVQAKPGELGNHKLQIQCIQCDCGKQDSIPIYLCCVECLPVYVRNTDINFPDTYLGLKSEEKIEIVNDGDMKVKFKFIDEESKFFEITPFKGEIDPMSSVKLKCSFHPPFDFESTNGPCSFVHEVTTLRYGSGTNQKNTEVHMSGIALAPIINILQNEIDLGSIHCGEVIEFELDCRNEGLIDGEIVVQDIESRFGDEITIDPQMLLLKPNDQGTFHVKYINCHIGRFLENLAFKVKFGDLLNVSVTGKVEKITFQISPEVLDFGEVSICCRQYQCMRIKNILNHPIKIDFKFDGQDSRSEETLLSFDEFEAIKPTQMVEMQKNSSSISFASYVSTTPQVEFSSLLEKLLFESDMEEISKDQIEKSLFSSVEAVNSVIGQILCKIDDYLDVDDFRQNLQRSVYQMIDDWIDSKKLVEILVDDVLEDLLKDTNQDCKPLVPFFEKIWILNENSQEYSLGVSTSILLKPLEMQTFRLNLVPNWPGIFRSRLKVFISWNDDRPCSSNITIPICHNCIIPDLVLCHTDIICLDLFVGQTSCNIIRIRNLNENIDGFLFAPTFENDELLIKCIPEKEIVPRDMEVNFKITVTPFVTGNLQYEYELYILGSDQPLIITFKVNSRPVRIKVNPKEVITENMLPGKVESAKFILMNLTPVQLKYRLRLAPNRYGTEAFEIEPYEPCLLPYDIVEVGIKQFFDTPGYYETCCFIDIQEDYGKSQEVKLKTHVLGIPLKIFPAIDDNLLDLGMIIYNKKPYPQLEFSVENTGQVKYFVVLKLMYDEDFKMNENRVEIQPRECKTFTIQICPKTPKNINNALFFNASLTGKIKDFETFKMINFKGKFIKQKVSFSKSEVSLEIRYDDDFNEKGHATIYLVNDSLIFLLIHCTINGDYELIDTENCLIGNFLDIELASKERRELMIQFNTKLIKNDEYQSKTFPAKLKAFVDGKFQSVIDVVTTLKYPTIEIPDNCLQVFQSQLEVFTNFVIRNSENIDAEYSWELVEKSLVFESLEKKTKFGAKSVIDEIFESEKELNVMENYLNETKSDEIDVETVDELQSEEQEEEISEVTSMKTRKKLKKKSKRVSIGSNISKGSIKKTKMKKKTKESSKIVTENASLGSKTTKIKKRRKSKGSIKSEKSIKSVSIAEESVEIVQPIIEISAKELKNGILDVLDEFQSIENLPSFEPKAKISHNNSILNNLLSIFPSKGLLQPENSQSISILFKPNPFPCKYSFDLRLNIKHGSSKTLKIYVINDEIHLELNKTEIDFGLQPWYAILRESFTISTTTSIPINVKFIKNCTSTEENLFKGRFLLKNEDGIKLNIKIKRQKVKLLTFLGISPDFETILGMEVNDRASILIKITGKSQIPNVTFINCNLTITKNDQMEDYLALRDFFNLQRDEKSQKKRSKVQNFVKYEQETLVVPANSSVSVAVKDFSDQNCEKIELEKKILESFDDSIRLTSDMKVIHDLESQDNIFDPYFDQNELDDLGYEVLTAYPFNDLPSFWEIKNYLEQSRLNHNFKNNPEVKSQMDNLTKAYVLQKFNSAHLNATPRYIYSGRPTNFVIEPIPESCLDVQCYSLDMGEIKIGESRKFSFEFVFHGPGIFNAAIRSDREIPGLSVQFQPPEISSNSGENDLPFKFSTKEYVPETGKTKARYHPCHELTHAHSHDFTRSLVHVRKPLNFDEKHEIKQYYNQLSAKHGKMKIRHPNTFAEIFQETTRDASGQIFNILFDFLPNTSSYGKKFLEFHEILHLDVHLGVSVVLHLKAKMFPKHQEMSCECVKPDNCLQNH